MSNMTRESESPAQGKEFNCIETRRKGRIREINFENKIVANLVILCVVNFEINKCCKFINKYWLKFVMYCNCNILLHTEVHGYI